jgi:hypothetical protein
MLRAGIFGPAISLAGGASALSGQTWGVAVVLLGLSLWTLSAILARTVVRLVPRCALGTPQVCRLWAPLNGLTLLGWRKYRLTYVHREAVTLYTHRRRLPPGTRLVVAFAGPAVALDARDDDRRTARVSGS